MCDTIVVVGPDAVGFAKNSDREPGEAQVVEHLERARHPRGSRIETTYLTIDQANETHEVVLSRPMWMWGAEMGANEHGLVCGNEAVFTRVPVESTGLLGMDLVRLALERCKSAEEALDLVTWMIDRHGQGGAAGFRNKRFRYHNAFVFADRSGAWLLETAGRFWAAVRVRGARTSSNVLTIGREHDRLGPGTREAARSLGHAPGKGELDFRAVFAAPAMAVLSGGDVRRACTLRALEHDGGGIDATKLARALRHHGTDRFGRARSPRSGARMIAPCAHASWLPTRDAGQTTGSMVSVLSHAKSTHWYTGTSAPCLSVLKPVPLGGGRVDTGPPPRRSGYDDASLFWRGERLHRVVLRDYDTRRATFEGERADLEARAARATTARAAGEVWREHRDVLPGWTARASSRAASRRARPFDAFWRFRSWRDGMPG